MQQPPGRPPMPPYRPPAGPPGTPGGGPPPGVPQGVRPQPPAPGYGSAPPPPPYPSQPPAGAPQAMPQQSVPPQMSGLPPVRRKNRASLRFLAGTCVFTAWTTLVLAIAFAGFSLAGGLAASRAAASAASGTQYFPAVPEPGTGLPGPGGLPGTLPGALPGTEDLGLPGGAGSLPGMTPGGGSLPLPGGLPGGGGLAGAAGLFRSVLPVLYFGSAAFTLVSGVVSFVLFLGLGQACYAILDLEEQALQNAQALQLILARLGGGR